MPGKGFTAAVAFADAEVGAFDFLVSGESVGAIDAFAASADGATIFGEAGIDYLVLKASAFGAVHLVLRVEFSRGLALYLVVSILKSLLSLK